MQAIRYLLVVAFLAFNHTILLSQAPGYLGKRTTLEVSGEWQLAVFNPTKKGESSFEALINDGFYDFKDFFKENKIRFNSTLTINSNYAISRVSSIGVKYHRATTGSIFQIYTSLGTINTLSEVGIQRIGLTYSSFKLAKASLAPIGTSYYVGLGGVFIDSKKMTTFFSGSNNETKPLNELHPTLETKVRAIDFSIGWNKRWLVVENIFIKTGLHFNAILRPNGMHFYGNNSSPSDYEADPIQATYTSAVLNRALMHNLFNFEVGIGAVLF